MSSPKNAEEYRQVPQSDRGAVAPLDIEDGRGTRPATTDVLRAVLATPPGQRPQSWSAFVIGNVIRVTTRILRTAVLIDHPGQAKA